MCVSRQPRLAATPSRGTSVSWHPRLAAPRHHPPARTLQPFASTGAKKGGVFKPDCPLIQAPNSNAALCCSCRQNTRRQQACRLLLPRQTRRSTHPTPMPFPRYHPPPLPPLARLLRHSSRRAPFHTAAECRCDTGSGRTLVVCVANVGSLPVPGVSVTVIQADGTELPRPTTATPEPTDVVRGGARRVARH